MLYVLRKVSIVVKTCGAGEDITSKHIPMTLEEYKSLSERTLSENFYVGDSAVKAAALTIIENYLESAHQLDMLKKVIFYGKDPDILGHDYKDFVKHDVPQLANATLKEQKLLHGAIGAATESAEILEQVFNSLMEGKDVDTVNIGEEIADTNWYHAIFLRELNIDFYQALTNNINKLAERYGDKFSEYKALNRDLDAERKILEA